MPMMPSIVLTHAADLGIETAMRTLGNISGLLLIGPAL